MRIGVDATCWANGRGYGRFVRHLLPALAEAAGRDELICFLDPKSASSFSVTGANVTRVVVAQRAAPTDAAGADGNRAPGDMLRLTHAVWRAAPDVFFSPTVYTYFPLVPGQRTVVTVHDAIAERFPELTLPNPRARLFWKAKVSLALAQSTLVLTVSDFAAREIASVIGVATDRIRVATEAPAELFQPSTDAGQIAEVAARYGLDRSRGWLIYVGGFNPHKRLDTVIEAHAMVCRARPALAPDLALVGTLTGDVFHGQREQLQAQIERHGTGDRVKWTGFVPDEELRHLHSGAIALLLPSNNEGFGLPAVEAAACGAAVIATTASPLPTLLAGGGYFVDPGHPEAVAGAALSLIDDPALRRRMGATAQGRARELTWKRCASAVLATLHEAAA